MTAIHAESMPARAHQPTATAWPDLADRYRAARAIHDAAIDAAERNPHLQDEAFADAQDAARAPMRPLYRSLADFEAVTPQQLAEKAALLIDGDEDGETAQILARDAARVAEVSKAAQATWAANRAEYEAAKAAYKEAEDRTVALEKRLLSAAPPWNVQARERDGKPLVRFYSLASYDREAGRGGMGVSRDEVKDWFVHHSDLLLLIDREHRRMEEIDEDRVLPSERQLIETPAPDIAALTYKLGMLGCETDDKKTGYDDPIYLAARLDQSLISDSWPAWIWRDAMTLSGNDHPGLAPQAFAPRDWGKRWKDAGGTAKVDLYGDKLSLGYPEDQDVTLDLMAELGQGRNREILIRYLDEAR